MKQTPISVYIPFLANVAKKGPCGGFKKLKKYVCKSFARKDVDGSMILGTVKKVEIVAVKNEMMKTDGNDLTSVSAYIKFVPSGTKACEKLIDEINSDDGLRFIHNTNKLLFWIIRRQRKQQPKETCPLCGNECKMSENKQEIIDDFLNAFQDLRCDDGPSRKRIRI